MQETNIEKYKNVFISVFNVPESELNGGFEAEKVAKWDSITHLSLCTAIEDEFDIMFDSEDMLELRSFEKGKEILAKYEIEF